MNKRLKFFAVFILCLMLPLSAFAASDIVKAGEIIIPPGEKVFGDVVSFQGDIEIHGEVFGDVVALLGRIIVYPDGAVHGDVVTLGGSIELHSGGLISGDQVSLGGGLGLNGLRLIGGLFTFNLGRAVYNVAIRILLAVLVGAVFPIPLNRVMVKLERNPSASAGAGLLVWLAVLPLTVIVALTIIGIPLSLLLLLALWAAIQLGFAAVAKLAGSRIIPGAADSLVPVAIGSLLLGLIMIIPFVGLLARMLLGLVGVGAAVLTRFGTRDGL